MKLNDDYEDLDINRAKSVSAASVMGILFIVTVLGIVIAINAAKTKKPKTSVSSVSTFDSVEETTATSFAQTFSDDNVTVSDLDFYEMYPKDDSVASAMTSEEFEEEKAVSELDETNDGKHTKIVWQDGTEEWIAINPYLQKHDYDLTNLISRSGHMEYYDDGKVVSKFGIDVSQENDYIDYNKVAKAGADFVMIRVGARGYQTGNLTIDEYFTDNIKRANDAGLKVGVYFISQAVDEEEAEEEAELVLDEIEDFDVDYPVCFMMQYTDNEFSRVEAVDRSQKTMIARAFLNRIKEDGYKTMLYGSKLWLLKYVDLTRLLSDYDIWLSQPEEVLPDFPYKFAMWQYNKSGQIDGVKGNVNFNVALTDFSLK